MVGDGGVRCISAKEMAVGNPGGRHGGPEAEPGKVAGEMIAPGPALPMIGTLNKGASEQASLMLPRDLRDDAYSMNAVSNMYAGIPDGILL